MWYQEASLVVVTTLCTVIMLSAGLMINERGETATRRYNPWFNFFRGGLIVINLLSVLNSLDLMPDDFGISMCQGWNVWAFSVVMRYAWLSMLAYDFVGLFITRYLRRAVRNIFFVYAGAVSVVMFVAMTFYDSVGAWPDAKESGCYMSSSVQAMFQTSSALFSLAIMSTVVMPFSRFTEEVIHGALTSISGISVDGSLLRWTGEEFVPRHFAEYDAMLVMEREPDSLSSSAAAAAAAAANFDEGCSGYGGGNMTEIELDSFSVVEQRGRSRTSPAIDVIAFEAAVKFDPICRRHGFIAALLTLLMTAYLSHTGAWNFHPAWKMFVLAAYILPLFYWQWFNSIRPAYYTTLRDPEFFAGSRALTDIETVRARNEMRMIPLNEILDYYVQVHVCAEGSPKSLTEKFLRSKCNATGRDRFRELYLTYIIFKRREEPDPRHRRAMAEYIQTLCLFPTSPLRLEYLESPLMNVLVGAGVDPAAPDAFDNLALAMLPVLDQRIDKTEIMESRRRQEQIWGQRLAKPPGPAGQA